MATMKILKNARETLATMTDAAEDVQDAAAVQTAMLLLVGIGVIVSIAVGVAALMNVADR